MLAIALPVISRKAVTMSSLRKQNPVSSEAATVPGKARLKRETFTITRLPASLALNEGESGSNTVPRQKYFWQSGAAPTSIELAWFGICGYDGNQPSSLFRPANKLVA
jgi:hypothetical protein